MPDFQFHEIHAVAVKANGAQVFAALEAVTPSELPAFRILMGLRSLPAFAVRRRPAFGFGSAPLLEQAKHAGFLVLGEETDRELVLGMVGQPWRLLGARMPASLHSAADFVSFREPGFAKMATNFRFELSGSPEQESRLVTETRVWLPDPPTARRFGAYWVLIRAGSGLIRREWLSRIKARAEAAAG